jgi:hypothetical protein
MVPSLKQYRGGSRNKPWLSPIEIATLTFASHRRRHPMKKLLVAAAIVAGSCSLVMAQGTGSGSGAGTGQGTSSAPSLQKQGTGGMNTERTAAPRVAKVKKKKKKSAM